MTARILVLVSCVTLAEASSGNSDFIRVADFDSGAANSLGGSYNSYGSKGCEVILQQTPLFHRGPNGQSLKVTYKNTDAVSCGFWMHTFKEEDPPLARAFPDAKRFPFLSLWVRSEAALSQVEIRMADSVWLAKDDSKPAGNAARYLRHSAEAEWSQVIVPYRDFALPSTNMAVFVVQFAPNSNGVLYLDDISVKLTETTPIPFTGPLSSSPVTEWRRAMWLWKTAELLNSLELQQRALLILEEARVTDLFLQVPYRRTSECIVEHAAELRHFLSAAHTAGIRVHALDGYPEFAVRRNHEQVLSLVRGILAFNRPSDRANKDAEAFDGIHLDNEPYQLLGFDGSARGQILLEYLELNRKVVQLLQSQSHKLEFGVDIPFWWDANAENGQPCCLVDFNGTRKTAMQHTLDLVDNAGVMAYRNVAGGMDGIVNHAQGEVAYASSTGRKVFVGVETIEPEPAHATFVAVLKESQWQALPPDSKLLHSSNVADYPLRSFTDGSNRYIGLADLGPARLETPFADALQLLRKSLEELCRGWDTDLRNFQPSLTKVFKTRPDVGQFSFMRAEQAGPPSYLLSLTETMPAKTTFASMSRTLLDEMLLEVRRAFNGQTGFAGDAIHSIESYRQLRKE